MAIYDALTSASFGAAAPVQGEAIGASVGYDLNADFGNGPDPRKAQYPGQTGELMIRVDVFADFVAGQGTPHAQFHAVASEVGSPFVTSSNLYTAIGSNVGPFDTVTSLQTVNGYLAAELTIGKSFFIRLNPWMADMGRSVLSGSSRNLAVQDLRYIGLVISIPEAATGAEDYFSAGSVIGYFVNQSEIAWDPGDFIYPSGFTVT